MTVRGQSDGSRGGGLSPSVVVSPLFHSLLDPEPIPYTHSLYDETHGKTIQIQSSAHINPIPKGKP